MEKAKRKNEGEKNTCSRVERRTTRVERQTGRSGTADHEGGTAHRQVWNGGPRGWNGGQAGLERATKRPVLADRQSPLGPFGLFHGGLWATAISHLLAINPSPPARHHGPLKRSAGTGSPRARPRDHLTPLLSPSSPETPDPLVRAKGLLEAGAAVRSKYCGAPSNFARARAQSKRWLLCGAQSPRIARARAPSAASRVRESPTVVRAVGAHIGRRPEAHGRPRVRALDVSRELGRQAFLPRPGRAPRAPDLAAPPRELRCAPDVGARRCRRAGVDARGGAEGGVRRPRRTVLPRVRALNVPRERGRQELVPRPPGHQSGPQISPQRLSRDNSGRRRDDDLDSDAAPSSIVGRGAVGGGYSGRESRVRTLDVHGERGGQTLVPRPPERAGDLAGQAREP